MINAVGLGIIFQARDEAKEVAEKLKEALHGLHEQAEKTHEGVFSALAKGTGIATGVALAVGGIAAAAAFEFSEHAELFSQSLHRAAIAAHASNEEFENLERFAKNRALDSLNDSAINVARGLQQLALEGFNTEEASQALNGALNLMKISMGALDERGSAGIVHDTLAQFGMAADKSSELVDKLAFAMQHFGFRAEELQPTMSGLAAGAHLTGSSLDDVLVGVGLVHQVFPSATKSAMAMNVAMNQLADTHHQQMIAQTLGIQVTDQHTKKLRPLVDIMRDLSVKTEKMSEAQLSHTLEMIAGGRAAGGLSAIIDGLRKGVTDGSGKLLTGAAALDFYRKSLNESDGAAKKMGDALNDDLGGAITSFKKALSNAGVFFGEQFEKPFTRAVQVANLAVRGLTQLFAQGGFSGEVLAEMDKAGNGGIKNFAIQVFLWVKRIQNFFSNLIDTFHTTFERFEPIVHMLSDAFNMLGQALGLTSQTADQNASKFDAFGNAGAGLGEILANVAGILMGLLLGAVLAVIEVVEALKVAWDELGPSVLTAFQIVKGAFGVLGSLITGDWNGVWNGLVDIVFGAMKGAVQIVGGAVGLIAKLVDTLTFGKFNLSATVDDAISKDVGLFDRAATSIKDPGKVTTSPALATITRQENFRKFDDAQGEGRPSFLEPPAVHVHASLHVDGEKLAEAVKKAQRMIGSRSYHAGDDKGGDH